MSQASQASQVVLDRKEPKGHQVFQVYQEDQVVKVTLAFQDSKVNVEFESGLRKD